MSPDNTKIACVTSNIDLGPAQHKFILYDITRECVNKRYDINIRCPHYNISYSTNGRYIAIVSSNNILICCGINGNIISTHKEPTDLGLGPVFFSTDNNSVIISSSNYTTIWDIISKRILSRKRDFSYSVLLSPDQVHYLKSSRFEIKMEMKHTLNKDFRFILTDLATYKKYSYTGKYLLTHEKDTVCIRNGDNGYIYFRSPIFSPSEDNIILYSHMCINNRYVMLHTSRGYIYTYDMHGRWTPSRYLQFNKSHQRLSLYTWILAQKLQFERMDLPILPTEIWILIISMYWYNDVLL